MLKSREIKALSNKMNFNIKTTEHCLKILFSQRGSSIDNDVMHEEEILEFFRICIRSKNKKERDRLFYTKFLPTLAKKDNKSKTMVYFIRDNFFSAMLAYLDAIEVEGIKFEKKFDTILLDNIDTFYFSMPEDYMDYPTLIRKKSDITDNLLSRILDEIDLRDYECVFEQDYILKLSVEIAREVGFQLFIVDMFRDVIVGTEEIAYRKESLNNLSDNLQFFRKKRKDKYIFMYCLCESLREKGYKAEETYKIISKLIYEPSSTIRTRYFEQKKEMKLKGIDYKNLINIHGLEFKINKAIKDISKLNPNV